MLNTPTTGGQTDTGSLDPGRLYVKGGVWDDDVVFVVAVLTRMTYDKVCFMNARKGTLTWQMLWHTGSAKYTSYSTFRNFNTSYSTFRNVNIRLV